MSVKVDEVNKTPGPPTYRAQRGPEKALEKVVEDYTDVFHRNIFSVDFPITLTKLGFYGPPKIEGNGNSEIYDVEWEISYAAKPARYTWFFFEKRRVRDGTLASGRGSYEATAGNIFEVPVGNIGIPPNEGIEIAFALNGPKTGKMEQPNRCVGVKTAHRVVSFFFNEGSMQMPELYFEMEEEKPEKSDH